jgi:hypothetical protein
LTTSCWGWSDCESVNKCYILLLMHSMHIYISLRLRTKVMLGQRKYDNNNIMFLNIPSSEVIGSPVVSSIGALPKWSPLWTRIARKWSNSMSQKLQTYLIFLVSRS